MTLIVLHLHLTSLNCMSPHALILSLSTFIACLSFHLVFQLQTSTTTLSCSLFSWMSLALLVPLSSYFMLLYFALCLCLLISCFFVLHCAPCPAPSHTKADLFCIFSLQILTACPLISFSPFIAASLATLNSISVHTSCTSNPLSTNHISCSLSCAFSSIYLICNTPLSCTFVESNVLNLCLECLSNPMSCTFDLHLWLAPLNPMASLALLSCFLSCTFSYVVFLHFGLAHWFPLSCTFDSYYVHNKTCNFVLILKSLCLASWACLSAICLAPPTPLSITCLHLCLASLVFFILHSHMLYSVRSLCTIYWRRYSADTNAIRSNIFV